MRRLKQAILDLQKLARILVLVGFVLVRFLALRLRTPRAPEPISKVFFFRFKPRSDYAGGDTVVNRYVQQVLEDNGITVDVVYPPERKPVGVGFFRWTFGDLWLLRQFAKKAFPKMPGSLVLTDSQLCLGPYGRASVSICHFSFLGYSLLVNKGQSLSSLLDMAISSLIQAYGLAYTRNIAVSEFQRKYLEMEGIRVSAVINNPMSLVEPRPIEKTGDFIFLAGYSYYGKGFDVLERLAERGWNIDCYTTGKRTGRLHYKAPIDHGVVLETIQRYKILLHPSRFESCGMTVLEALSCGVPVIMASVGVGESMKKEIPEFVVSGYDHKAIEEYQEKAAVILADYDRYSRLARSYVQRHHNQQSFQEQWKQVILGKTPRP